MTVIITASNKFYVYCVPLKCWYRHIQLVWLQVREAGFAQAQRKGAGSKPSGGASFRPSGIR